MNEEGDGFRFKDMGPKTTYLEADPSNPEAVANAVSRMLDSPVHLHQVAGRIIALDVTGLIHKWVAEEIKRKDCNNGDIISAMVGILASIIGNDMAYFAKPGHAEITVDKILAFIREGAMVIVKAQEREGHERVRDRMAELKNILPPNVFKDVEREAKAEGLLLSEGEAISTAPAGVKSVKDTFADLLSNLGREKPVEFSEGPLALLEFVVKTEKLWKEWHTFLTDGLKRAAAQR